MDETPEELEQIRREAAKIDPNKYKKRWRALAALALGGVAAAAVVLGMDMWTASRNPCERLVRHFCGQSESSNACKTWDGIFKESVEDPSPKMRGLVRAQCETKITRLKEEENQTVE